MKYILILDDSELTDLRYEFNRYTLTARINGREKLLIPGNVPMVINEFGTVAYLTPKHIEALQEVDKNQMTEQLLDQFEDYIRITPSEDEILSVNKMRIQLGLPALDNGVARLSDDEDPDSEVD